MGAVFSGDKLSSCYCGLFGMGLVTVMATMMVVAGSGLISVYLCNYSVRLNISWVLRHWYCSRIGTSGVVLSDWNDSGRLYIA